MKKLNKTMAGIGLIGFLIGSYLGFLVRPTAFLVGQLPFEMVITRGANLQGFDQILLPLAQQSFSIMLTGGVIGAIVGIVTGYYIGKRKTTF